MELSEELKAWKDSGRGTTYRDWNVFHKEAGSGTPLLLLHGFPTASFDWAPIWEELTAKFRVIAPDFLGYGFSDKPTNYDYHVMDHANQVEALLEELGVSSYGILAHDYGDTVAQELIARDATRKQPTLQFVCFLNGGLFAESHRPRLIQKLLLWPTGPLVAKLLNERKFNKSFSEVFGPNTQPNQQLLQDCWHLIALGEGARNYHRLIRYIPQRKEFRDRWVLAMQNTKTRMRLINGPLDPVSGRHMVERYRQLMPNPDCTMLEGIGHYPQIEDPQGVLREFLSFALS